jgi:hypothetical protein
MPNARAELELCVQCRPETTLGPEINWPVLEKFVPMCTAEKRSRGWSDMCVCARKCQALTHYMPHISLPTESIGSVVCFVKMWESFPRFDPANKRPNGFNRKRKMRHGMNVWVTGIPVHTHTHTHISSTPTSFLCCAHWHKFFKHRQIDMWA